MPVIPGMGGRDWDNHGPGQPGQKVGLCLQNNQSKKGQRHGSSNKALT
jgi:hypothetical protein